MSRNIKSIVIVVGLGLAVILAAQQSGPKPKTPVKTEQQPPARDPEDRWVCRIGSPHDCHCPAMMAEEQDAAVKHCGDTSKTHEEYVACLGKVPSNCDVIQKPDEKHPEHSCRRNCKAIAGCQCDDGPICRGPQVWHPPDSDDSGEVH
jgi:hypothetical protein